MEKKLKSLLIGLVLFSIFYLLGAFYSASFDISEWHKSVRFFISFCGGVFSLIMVLILNIDIDNK